MAPAESVQCICGSTKVWPSSGGEETSTGRYFVDGFLLTSDSTFVDSGGNYRNKKYYKTSETTIVNGESYPVYLSEDGLYKIKAEVANSIVLLRIYDSSDVYRSITLDNAEGSLTPENLFVDLSEVNYWASAGEDESVTLTEVPAPAIKITLTPVRSDSSSLAYGNGTYELQESLTTTYGGKTYPVYYCSTNKMYLFVATGNDTNLIASAYNDLLTPGNIYLVMKLNESADVWRWSDLGAAPASFAFLRTSYLSYLNSISWTDFVDDQGESESFTNWGGLSVKTIELSLSSGSSSAGENIKLQGFGSTYFGDMSAYNGIYELTNQTSNGYPAYYCSSNGKWLSVAQEPMYSSLVYCLGNAIGGNQGPWSNSTNISSFASAEGKSSSWNYDAASFTAIGTLTSESSGGSTPEVTTFTLTVNYSGTAPSGAKWIVNSVEHEFGSSATLEAGTYTITYKAVSGYTTPSSQSVTGTAGGSETITANAYVAETPSVTYPNAFVIAGHSTDNYNGTYVKQATTTTYNGTPYPVYYNGVYYLWHDSNSNTALLGTSSDMSNMSSGMPYYYVGGGYKSNISNFTASSLTGSWSQGMMGTTIALTFTESSSTTPSAGSGEGTAPSSGTPYLYLTNSSTTTYNGYYALVSGTPSASGSKWKHVAKNYWIGYYMSWSPTGPKGWHVYSNANSVGTENVAQRNVGSSSSNIASTLFAGGATCNGYTITYEDNGYS